MKYFLFFSLGFYFIACSQRPSREKFPGKEGETVSFQGGQAPRALLGGFDPLKSSIPVEEKAQMSAANPNIGDEQEAKTRQASENELSIKGTVKLGKGASVTGLPTLFLSLRAEGQAGPPLAAMKVAQPELPFQFHLNDSHLIGRGIPEGTLKLKAKLDVDGDPLSSDEGDLEGVLIVKAKQKGVKLVLRTCQKLKISLYGLCSQC